MPATTCPAIGLTRCASETPDAPAAPPRPVPSVLFGPGERGGVRPSVPTPPPPRRSPSSRPRHGTSAQSALASPDRTRQYLVGPRLTATGCCVRDHTRLPCASDPILCGDAVGVTSHRHRRGWRLSPRSRAIAPAVFGRRDRRARCSRPPLPARAAWARLSGAPAWINCCTTPSWPSCAVAINAVPSSRLEINFALARDGCYMQRSAALRIAGVKFGVGGNQEVNARQVPRAYVAPPPSANRAIDTTAIRLNRTATSRAFIVPDQSSAGSPRLKRARPCADAAPARARQARRISVHTFRAPGSRRSARHR